MFWRAPKRAVEYTYQSNLALASDIGRRWIVWGVFGLWLWGLRWVAVNLVPPLRTISAVLLLLWFWHGVNLVRWTLHARPGASRARALARQDHAILQELRGDMREAITSAGRRTGERTFTMLGSMRHHDPVADEHRTMARDQADQVRTMLPPDQQGWKAGTEFERVVRMPKWMRRKDKR